MSQTRINMSSNDWRVLPIFTLTTQGEAKTLSALQIKELLDAFQISTDDVVGFGGTTVTAGYVDACCRRNQEPLAALRFGPPQQEERAIERHASQPHSQVETNDMDASEAQSSTELRGQSKSEQILASVHSVAGVTTLLLFPVFARGIDWKGRLQLQLLAAVIALMMGGIALSDQDLGGVPWYERLGTILGMGAVVIVGIAIVVASVSVVRVIVPAVWEVAIAIAHIALILGFVYLVIAGLTNPNDCPSGAARFGLC